MVNNLYAHEDENGQALFFYLNISIKGNIKSYKDLDGLKLEKKDAVITANLNRSNALAKRDDYRLIVKSKEAHLFRKI